MERAWDINPGATASVTVAVLDSGVAYRNAEVRYRGRAVRLEPGGPVYPALGLVDVPFAAAPDLGDQTRFVAPRDFIWNDDLPLDLDGHGTHVAGTIGQATNNGIGVAGMAFNVRIMPVKVISDTWDFIFGNDAVGSDDVVAQGIRYAADNGAHVINMSIGRESGGPATVVEDAVRYAVSKGVFVAIAAGNDGNGQNRPNRHAEFASRIDGAVAVAAVGRGLDRAYYSTTGSFVEIAAPGGDQRLSGGEGGVLQQMVDQDLVTTYTLSPALFRAPRYRRVPLLLPAGHLDGDSTRGRVRGPAAPAGDHQSRRDRGGHEAVCHRPRAERARRPVRRRTDQPEGHAARPRPGPLRTDHASAHPRHPGLPGRAALAHRPGANGAGSRRGGAVATVARPPADRVGAARGAGAAPRAGPPRVAVLEPSADSRVWQCRHDLVHGLEFLQGRYSARAPARTSAEGSTSPRGRAIWKSARAVSRKPAPACS